MLRDVTGTALAPIAYRHGSAAAAVHDWVTALPSWSVFKPGDVPGPRQVVAKTLSQMAARDARLERVAQGVYLRPGGPSGQADLNYNIGRVAMAVAGAGSGYGELTAVNALGWNWQTPVRYQVCAVGRAPRTRIAGCEFLARSNEARRDLTWAEVTVLEALLFFRFAGWDWDTCVEIVADGSAARRMGSGAVMRRDALREVGGLEPRANDRYRTRLRGLTAAMPATTTSPDHALSAI